jgi:outer membrane lipoprotein-sorting protein
MFRPIDWSKTSANDIKLTAFDAASGEATLAVKHADGLVRQIVLQGTPWRIIHSTLMDQSDSVLSDTTMTSYQDSNGVRIPTQVTADFPGEKTHIEFELRNLRANTALPETMFNFECPPGQ